MPHHPLYFSGDLEASGPVAPIYTMLSVGFCTLDEKNPDTFYVELKPITTAHDIDAMRIGCRGLSVVTARAGDPLFDTYGDRFDPVAVLAELEVTGEHPIVAMQRLAQWVETVTTKRTGTPRAVYRPSSFESSFLPYYFHAFADGNPFGHSAEDANSYLRGALGDPNASYNKLRSDKHAPLTHHALEDALEQASGFREILKLAKENRIRRELRHPTR